MRVCIVGANGLLGQNLLRTAPSTVELWGAGLEETALSPSLSPANYRQLDLTDLEAVHAVLEECAADWVINAAAMTAVDRCETEPELCRAINCTAPATMAQLSNRFVQISTDYVFDGRSGPYREEAPTAPLSVYGSSKLDSEKLVLDASPHHLVVRTMTLYGRGIGLRPSFVDWVEANLQQRKELPLVTDQIGNPTLASSLARSLWALVQQGASGLYHISGGERCSRYEWAERVARYLGEPTDLFRPLLTRDLKQPAARPLESGFVLEKIAKIPSVVIDTLDQQLQCYFEEIERV